MTGAWGGRVGPAPVETSTEERSVPPSDNVRMLAPALLVAALTLTALAQGGRAPGSAVVAFGLLAAAVLASGWSARWSRAELADVPVLPGAVLCGWLLVRGAVSDQPMSGLRPALLLVAAFAVALVVRRLCAADVEWFLPTLLGVGVLVAATGWVGVVVRREPWGHLDGSLWRAATAVTYENAAAGLLVPMALLAVGLAAAGGPGGVRRGCSVLAMLLLVGAGATWSRGGGLALAVGLVVLVALLRGRAFGALPPLVGAAVALAALLPSVPAGRSAAPVLALAGLAVGVAIAAAPLRRPLLLGGAGVLVAGGAAGLAVTDRWDALAAGRLSLVSLDRAEQARAALALWWEHPWVGVGPQESALQWQRPDGLVATATYVHNEYLQTLVDLGLVGALLLAALVAGVVRLVRAGRRTASDAGAYAGAVAGLAAAVVHSSLDFLWHVPAVPFVVAALVGVAAQRGDSHEGN